MNIENDTDRSATDTAGGGRRYSLHLGYLFTELVMSDRVRSAAEWGFAAVEHPAPYSMAEELISWLGDANLSFAQLAAPSGDSAKGEKGLAIFPDRQSEFRESVKRGLDLAGKLGCDLLHVMSGIRPRGVTDAVLWQTYLQNMDSAARLAKERDIAILIEPIGPGTIADYFIGDPEIALQAIDELGCGNVFLLLDVFHAANAGVDIPELIRERGSLIRHVQIADFPGRHEPGTGSVDFAAIFRALDDARYAGYIGCEYNPLRRTASGLGWLSDDPFTPLVACK